MWIGGLSPGLIYTCVCVMKGARLYPNYGGLSEEVAPVGGMVPPPIKIITAFS